MRSIIDFIKQEGIIVVFDVDGVLAPYEWGFAQHCIPDKIWNNLLDAHDDVYARVKPIQALQNFVHNKSTKDCYVCSCSTPAEATSKRAFCVNNYGIEPDHVHFVSNKSDKLLFLNSLRDELGIPENRIAIVEDTVETLDAIAKDHKYITVHISSFL